jgi:chromosome segregation ATPase
MNTSDIAELYETNTALASEVERLTAHLASSEGKLNDALVEIERLRDALRDISTTAHCISKAGPLNTKTLAEAWNKFDHISVEATGAIKPPKK